MFRFISKNDQTFGKTIGVVYYTDTFIKAADPMTDHCIPRVVYAQFSRFRVFLSYEGLSLLNSAKEENVL